MTGCVAATFLYDFKTSRPILIKFGVKLPHFRS